MSQRGFLHSPDILHYSPSIIEKIKYALRNDFCLQYSRKHCGETEKMLVFSIFSIPHHVFKAFFFCVCVFLGGEGRAIKPQNCVVNGKKIPENKIGTRDKNRRKIYTCNTYY